jgi:hypothetical protein
MTEIKRPAGYRVMCFLGIVENSAILLPGGFSLLFNVMSTGVPLQRESGSPLLAGETLMLVILPVLGLAGIIISLALLGRGRVAATTLYAYLLARWLILLSLLHAGIGEYSRLKAGWDGGLAQPGREDPLIMIIAIVALCLLHLPLFVASAYWWRPRVRTYAMK